MSELKATTVYNAYWTANSTGVQVYLKSEADKVFALLKDKANYNEYAYKLKSEELADTCRFYEKELRHHKYKRCLAMADACRGNFLVAEHMIEKEPKNLMWHKRHKHYGRWMMLWRCFAEGFKETK